jgi:phosphoesterase RecJ-like protein
MDTQIHQRILTALQASKRILIVSHRKPDGDTIGAALALAHYCERVGKPYRCFCVDTPAPYLQFLPKAHEVTNDPMAWTAPDLDVVVVVDAGDLKYAGVDQLVQTIPGAYTLIDIDHHVTNPGYGQINLVDSTASSTCEIVYHLLDSVRAVDRRTATCLLTGLITDTGSFSNLATTASAVDVAAKLLAKGANLPQISKQALQYRPYNSLKLWGRALERLHEDPTTGMIVTAVTLQDIHECNADEEAVSGISNFLNGLDQAAEKIIMVLAQSQPGVIKGSLRTTHPLLDVTEFAKLYGGGGHKKAAGFSLTGTLELTPTGYVIKPA